MKTEILVHFLHIIGCLLLLSGTVINLIRIWK